MKKLYKNKYRSGTTRLKNWDYGSAAMYFVTICTQNKAHYFGKIVKRSATEEKEVVVLEPAEIGEVAITEWYRTFELREDMNLKLGKFIVMPNHIHGVIIIGPNKYNTGEQPAYKNQFIPQSKKLASIIRGYKSAVTTYARKNNIAFNWQRLYYEHIVRSLSDLNRINAYIKYNPEKWWNKYRNM